jgi:hypothetical protein
MRKSRQSFVQVGVWLADCSIRGLAARVMEADVIRCVLTMWEETMALTSIASQNVQLFVLRARVRIQASGGRRDADYPRIRGPLCRGRPSSQRTANPSL